MLVRSPSVLPEIEDMGITSPSSSFMQQRLWPPTLQPPLIHQYSPPSAHYSR
ncbi:MAG: hypothetical protein VB125_04630 [Burkholderia sp.]